mmetsp:Transcript_70210/g.178065  ORF Transcript_70210/g.178065 Transcript_70210/m.178065 type:complete len:344 (-) Transcript_70210:947-1978(-)
MDGRHLQEPVGGRGGVGGPDLLRSPPIHQPHEHLSPMWLPPHEVAPLPDQRGVEVMPLRRRASLEAFEQMLAVAKDGRDEHLHTKLSGTSARLCRCTSGALHAAARQEELQVVLLDLEAVGAQAHKVGLEHRAERVQDVRQPLWEVLVRQLPHEANDLGSGIVGQQPFADSSAKHHLIQRQERSLLDLFADLLQALHDCLDTHILVDAAMDVCKGLIVQLDLSDHLQTQLLLLPDGLRHPRRRRRHGHCIGPQDLSQPDVAASRHHEDVWIPPEKIRWLARDDTSHRLLEALQETATERRDVDRVNSIDKYETSELLRHVLLGNDLRHRHLGLLCRLHNPVGL